MEKTEKTIQQNVAFLVRLIDEGNVITLSRYTFKQIKNVYYINDVQMDFDPFKIFLKGFFLENYNFLTLER